MKKILAVLIAASMLLSAVSCSLQTKQFDLFTREESAASGSVSIEEIQYSDVEQVGSYRYARELLPEHQRSLYDMLNDYVYKLQTQMIPRDVTEEELTKVISYFRSDNPQVFWMSEKYQYEYNPITNKIKSLELSYSFEDSNGEEKTYTLTLLEQMKAQINQKAEEILSAIPAELSDFDKVQLVHDYLATQITYDELAGNRYTLYGALVDGRAVCEGISDAFMYLMSRMGIESYLVYGSSLENEPHSWNIVKIDGAYYHIDITWDMPDENSNALIYAYCNVSDDKIRKEHVVHSPQIGTTPPKEYKDYTPIPVCDQTKDNYYVRHGLWVEQYSNESAQQMLNKLEEACAQKQESIQFLFNSIEDLNLFIADVKSGNRGMSERFPYSNKQRNVDTVAYPEQKIIWISFDYSTQ